MHRPISLLVIAVVALTGCFTSTVPFYEDGQVVQDQRIEGTYDSSRDGKKDESVWDIEPSKERDDHGKLQRRYSVTVRDGDVSIELLGTLFRLDKLLFLDLYPVRDCGMRDGGGVPTVSEVIRSAMYERRHVVWKVEFADTGLTIWFPTENGSARAVMLAPELKRARAEGIEIALPASTREVQGYLRRFATNSSVFDYRGELVRRKKDA
jgi:hypothetical protein